MSNPTTITDPSWQWLAVCHPRNGHDPEIWFPPEPRPYATHAEHAAARRRRIQAEAKAKRLCAGCPVARECLQWADSHDIRIGVWGGMTTTERGKTPLR